MKTQETKPVPEWAYWTVSCGVVVLVILVLLTYLVNPESRPIP